MILQDIKTNIEKTLNINLDVTSRKQALVDGRIIFCLMSLSKGSLKYAPIVAVLKKDHCSIIHYKKLSVNLIKYNNQFRQKYINCLESFGKTKQEIEYYLSDDFLKIVTKKKQRITKKNSKESEVING